MAHRLGHVFVFFFVGLVLLYATAVSAQTTTYRLHNEDSGTKIVVTSKGVSKEVIATYDSNDKVTKRQTSVDLAVAS